MSTKLNPAAGDCAEGTSPAVRLAECISMMKEFREHLVTQPIGSPMHRAYSTIEFKSFEQSADGRTYFEGIASTPTPDRMGDIVEPKGAQFKMPMPFLYQHDAH